MRQNIIRDTNKGVSLSTSASTILYTAPSNYSANVRSLFICSKTVTDTTITIQWLDASTASTYTIIQELAVAGKDYTLIELNIILEEGDIIKATAGNSDILDVTLNVEENYWSQV